MNERKPMKIVFMGTPAFAVHSLNAIVKAGFDVSAVVTAPDRPSGRGMKLQPSEVKKYALDHDIQVLQPTNLKSPEFVASLQNIAPDLQVVVAFRMLPEVVWNLPPLGTINLHASLLPQYRGAAPINHAIINGETQTGLTTFKLKHDIDTGNILLQKIVEIEDADNAGSLHDKLMIAGGELLVQTLKEIESGTAKEIRQSSVISDTELKHAPKIFTQDCEIVWENNTERIYNLIRGLSPRPGAFTFLNDKRIIILMAEKEKATPEVSPGQYVTDHKTYLKMAAEDGYISIKELKPEGKGNMKIEDFLRGQRNL